MTLIPMQLQVYVASSEHQLLCRCRWLRLSPTTFTCSPLAYHYANATDAAADLSQEHYLWLPAEW